METQLAAIDNVSSFTDDGQRLLIKVRVVAVWRIPFSHTTMRQSCMDMILMDRKGTKIQGSVCRQHPILRSIETGRVYTFSRFRVLLNDDVRYTPHDYRLIFHSCTIIAESYDVRIPRNGWSFRNTEVIRARGDQFTHLIDCVGVVCAASQERLAIKDGQMSKMLEIDLQDSRGKIRCKLFGTVVEPMADYLASNWIVRPIVVFQFVKVKRIGDKFEIEGIPIASKVLINPEIAEVEELTQRMSIIGLNYHGPVGFLQNNCNNHSMMDDMLFAYPRKTLPQLNETKEAGIFIVHAGIVGVVRDGHWAYPSCRCFTELRRNGCKYDCLRCGRSIGQTINRFRFKVEVFDGVDSAVFVLYDYEAEQLTGFTCEELINTLELAKRDIIEGEFPDDIEDNIVGRELLFKVRNTTGLVYSKDVCFEVLRICFDHDIIAMFNDDDVIATPTQAMFKPPFTERDSSIGDDDRSSSLKAQLTGFSESISSAQSDRRLRRKLLADFEAYLEDSHDVDGNAGDTNANKSDVDDMTYPLEAAPSIDSLIVGADGHIVHSAVAKGGKVDENISPATQHVDSDESAESLAPSVGVHTKSDFEGSVIYSNDNDIDSQRSQSLDPILVEEESHVDEDIDDNLDVCGIKSLVKVEVVENYVDQFMDKVEGGKEVIVISDDDNFEA